MILSSPKTGLFDIRAKIRKTNIILSDKYKISAVSARDFLIETALMMAASLRLPLALLADLLWICKRLPMASLRVQLMMWS